MTTATKSIEARYAEKFAKSAEFHERGKSLFPGGITHQTQFRKPFPLYFERAQGAFKYDVNGNEIVDFVMGNGSLLLGSAHPGVVSAVSASLPHGSHFGGPNVHEIAWAELIKSMVPSIQRIRFTSTGTEATYLAMRLARNFKLKPKIVALAGHYHGWHEYACPSSSHPVAYMPPGVEESVIVAPTDTAAIGKILREDDEVAAVIVEANGASWGTYPLPNPRFLSEVEQMCNAHDVVFILDEVVTGFRLSKSGAQGRWGINPDLTTFGKVVAGGEPGAAVGGRKDIMEMLAVRGDPEWDNHKRVGHGGTFNGNPSTASAGIACLTTIRDEPINERADRNAQRLKDGLNAMFARTGLIGHAHGVSSIVHVNLGFECTCDREICTMTRDQIRETMTPQKIRLLRKAMLLNGVDMMGGHGFFVSSVHRDREIDSTVEAFERSLRELGEEGVI